jgi:arylformamidase
MTRVYDISVPIRDGGIVYPGNPEIHIGLQQAIARGAGANVSSVSFGSHTGTHVDAARHFFDNGETVDRIPLDRLMGKTTVIQMADEVRAIGRVELEQHVLHGVTRLLLKTRNSGYLTQDQHFHPDYTYLAPDGAEYLVSLGVKLVGVDYLSVEQFHSGHHMTHRTLLENDVIIVEGLQLDGIAPRTYELICLPLRLEGCDAAPARALLLDRDE